MQQRHAEALAAEPENVAPIGRAIVEVEDVGPAIAAKRADEDGEHVALTLLVHRLERDDVARRVVEERVDADWFLLARFDNRRPMADIRMPQGAGPLCLPPKARLGALAVTQGDAVEPLLAIEAPYRGSADRPLLDAALGMQRSQNERHARRPMLAPDVEQELALRI